MFDIISAPKPGVAIQGISPLTGLPVHFISLEPSPGRAKILVIVDDDWYYSPDAGLTWEYNPSSIDMRQIDVLLNKPNA